MAPVLLRFSNGGAERRVTVELSGRNADVQGEFVLPEKTESQHWLYVPMIRSYIGIDRVRIVDAESDSTLKTQPIGLGVRSVAGWSSGNVGYSPSDPSAVLLDVSGLSFDTEVWQPTRLSKITVASEEMPGDWRAYTGVSAVVVTHADWASPRMPRAALMDWMAMGGQLVLVDSSDEQQTALREELAKAVPFYEPKNRAESGKRNEFVGRGAVVFVRRGELRQPRFLTSAIGYHKHNVSGNYVHPSMLKLELSKKLPFGITLFFLIVFSTLIGPVGWWYVVRKRKQALVYYMLAPCVSICLALIVVQGVTPRAVCSAVEFIDHRVQKRMTTSRFTVFRPFTLGNTLQGTSGELPLFLGSGKQDYDPKESMSSTRLDSVHVSVQRDGDSVVYRGNALPARTETHFAFTDIRQERRRLDVQLENGGRIVVENHLGMDLRRLVIRHEGSYGVVDSLADGARATARSISRATALKKASNFYALSLNIAERSKRWRGIFSTDMQHNAYAAQRDDDYDGLVWLDSWRMQDSAAIVFGVY